MQTTVFEDIVKLQPKGLLTIPKKLRQSVGLTERSLLRIKAKGKQLIIEPVYTTPAPRTFSDEEIQEWLEFDKQETEALRKQGLL
ncbi:MAG: hypothetical protein UY16_C0029G0007 [Candidatus Gottesmanbacteria bacterium GW2011_GWA2_47_9]|uniref:SpoVT-AbrB domain-containing protein n=1 Tax=Candidatus Gottesmanbacteria bacterium GW2011_GWA2_47_9 TaxID=1618445 RepID=A0A0G1WAK3_9BACT|nr:MAG: hypothetical protein UY16_C0029G0007 [Candidatus Gottesmanbacteria bacterium GW2011_GWA2_47_9]